MSILDAGSAGTANDGGSTEGQTIDSLNQQFQDSTGQEGQGNGDNKETEQQGHSWFYDENIPGEGDRPEWLKDKYKSAADQAKAYNELDKKLGKFKGAPEEYDLTIPDMPDFKFEDGDPMLADFLKMAKDANASQEFVTDVLKHYINTQSFYAPDPEQELQKLGVNARQEIAQLSEWAGQRLSKEEFETFKGMITTADNFRIMQKLRRAATSQTEIPPTKGGTNQGQGQISERQLMELIADERFHKDPLFRAEVEAKAQKVWG